MSTNKFAEKQLKKHGWKEGSGLGKEEAGIKEAIKVKIKNDTAGIGHNRGDEFTFHWWDHVFNKAAGSISVEDSEEGVALKKSANNGPISNTRTKSYDNKAMLYGKFVKAATLSNGNYESQTNNVVESDSDDEKEKVRNRLVSDKALEMCEGMTAHKGARHGLKLSGKLVRVQEQEKLLLESMKKMLKKENSKNSDGKIAKEESEEEKKESDKSDNDSKNKQKKNKRKKNEDGEMKSETCDGSKKKKIKKGVCDNELSSDSGVDSEMLNKKKKKKKGSKSVERNNEECDENEDQQIDDSEPSSKKKKKNKNVERNIDECDENEDQTTVDIDSELPSKKKKKNKNVGKNHEESDENKDQQIDDSELSSKKKKKNKNVERNHKQNDIESELRSKKKKEKRKFREEDEEEVQDSDSDSRGSKKKKRKNVESYAEGVTKMSDSSIKCKSVTKKSKKKKRKD